MPTKSKNHIKCRARSFSHPLETPHQNCANDEGYEAHSVQAWALVVFGNVRAKDVMSSRGRFVDESARAFYSRRRFGRNY